VHARLSRTGAQEESDRKRQGGERENQSCQADARVRFTLEKGGYRRARQGQERKDGQIVIGQLRPRRTFRASVLASRVLSGLLEFAL